MSRVQLIDSSNTTPNRQALLEQVHKAFGATPSSDDEEDEDAEDDEGDDDHGAIYGGRG